MYGLSEKFISQHSMRTLHVVDSVIRKDVNAACVGIESNLVADGGQHLVDASLFFLGEDRQHAAQRTCWRPRHILSGLLVEVRNVERVLEHLAEFTVVDATVWTPVEADQPLALVAANLRLFADCQRQRRQELALGDAAAAQPVVVLEELGRTNTFSVDGHLPTADDALAAPQ